MSLISSILTGGPNSHQTTSEEANSAYTDFASEGIVGTIANTAGVAPATGGFAANATGTPDTNIQITAGVAVVTGTPSTQASQNFRIRNTSTVTQAISSNSSGSTKYDWVYIALNATNLNAPNTAGDNVATITVSRSSSSSADDGTPPTYGFPLAVVTVANGFSTITNGNIRDIRVQSGMTPVPVATSTASWSSMGATPSSTVYNGNRSYTHTWPTSILANKSVGMRNRYTRTVTAPTQCTSLNGTTQYYSKTSPNGLTFTDDFTCMGWVKLSSYAAGGIIARRNAATEGWSLSIATDGRVTMGSLRIAGNNSSTSSYQSLPLNKWVHVTATTDLSGTSVLIYIDGVLVPSLTTITGTITALVQGTTALVVGSTTSAGSEFFPGKIAQAAVFSSVLSAATIRSYISQGLAGNESTLISAYSFNNSINDLNANANNLTPQASAVATNTDSPFAGGDVLYQTDGTTEYSITTAISSDGLTETVQVPEGYAIPTSGGVSAVSYSTQKTPYGMPVQSGKWRVNYVLRTQTATASNATFAAHPGLSFVAPVGEWGVGFNLAIFNQTTTGISWNLNNVSQTGLNASQSDTSMQVTHFSSAAATGSGQFYIKKDFTLSSAGTFVLYSLGATTSAGLLGATASCELFAELSLL